MRTLLGADAYAQFEQHETVAPLREWIDQIARDVYYTDTPFTAAQADQLTQIVARHDPHLTDADSRWRLDNIDWDAATAEACSMLAPAQFAAWQGVVARVQWYAEKIRQLNQTLGQRP